jgi:hypothetical protein
VLLRAMTSIMLLMLTTAAIDTNRAELIASRPRRVEEFVLMMVYATLKPM